MRILRRGSRDPEVTFLQRLLNVTYLPTRGFAGIVEDGIFGQETETLLRRFQSENRHRGIATVDGIAGPQTWRALGLQTEIDYRLPRMGQNTGMTCWAVSGGLASGRMASIAAPGVETDATPGAGSFGGLYTDTTNMAAYARGLGMRLLPVLPATQDDIVAHLRRGPVIVNGSWPGSGQHVVVISGYFASSNPNGRMIKVNDPLPMGQGSIHVTEYPIMIVSDGPLTARHVIVR